MKIVFATGNAHKLVEIREILSDINAEILSMKDVGIDIDIVEDADTFEGNALIKARAIRDLLKDDSIVLADDSGLEIDALGGEPGVYSARYLGEDTPYEVKCGEIISRLDGLFGNDRSARFRCVIAIAYPDGTEEIAEGAVEGIIADKMMGDNGFGYDPIFYVPELDKTTAEMSPDEKNNISHRGNALRVAKEKIKKHFSKI